MPNDKTKASADRKRIDVHEVYELTHWSAKFGVSRERLEEAVVRF